MHLTHYESIVDRKAINLIYTMFLDIIWRVK